ncbi:MAG: hypothetical protein LR011_14070 [Verrucomicrobia bacterium]|nr:hypothetical protein [Verrucomicrobiota bacterium]
MIRFGGVPISVSNPPSKDAKAMGISNNPGDVEVFRPHWIATGMNKASAPTLFMKADNTQTAHPSTKI